MSEPRKRLGEILLEDRVIEENDLIRALDDQKTCLKRVGEILVANGAASRRDIFEALFVQLNYKTSTLHHPTRFPFLARLRLLRIPIQIKLSVLISILVLSVMLTASYFQFRSQKDEFLVQMVRFGTMVTRNLASNSAVPLLENDEAALNILVEEISKDEEVVYAQIINKNQLVTAHSNVNSRQLNKLYVPPQGATLFQQKEALSIQSFAEGGKERLDFSLPVTFNGVLIGTVHVGISLAAMQKKIASARLFAAALTVVLLIMGMVVAYFMSKSFSQPVYDLVTGTGEIKNGNFEYRIQPTANDELGDLTLAFNEMADGLMKKALIQDAFGRYVTPELVDKIMENPDQQWFKGQSVKATVFFADIRGFTVFTEEHAAEEVVRLLNEHFSLATEIITRHGGHVDKFIGDELLAVFGTLIKHEDHVLRAVQAACELQQALAERNAGTGYNGHRVTVGIGINSGDLIAGNIGSNKRMEYTVIGDTVNVASRLTHLAAPGEIIVNDAVRSVVAGVVECETMDLVQIKGKSQPMQIYRIKGLSIT